MARMSTLSFGQFLGSLQKIPGGTNRRADTQSSLRILGGVRIFNFFWMSLTVIKPLRLYYRRPPGVSRRGAGAGSFPLPPAWFPRER